MISYKWAFFTRAASLFSLITIFSLVIPHPVNASALHAITLNFEIAAVKMDESVTIRTIDFPSRTNFVAIMGSAVKKAADGVVSTEFNSGEGGKVEFTFPIPDTLKGASIIGLRVESKDGYYKAYSWFFNRTQTNLLPDSHLKPELSFSAIQRNTSVIVEGTNLVPGAVYRVRVGPYYTFYRDYVSYAEVTADSKGTVQFIIPLGKNVKDAQYISVRLDSASDFVFASFQNKDNGRKVTESEMVRIVPCTLLYINPIPPLDPREDFDVVWTVQNTGLEDWNHRRFLFKYRGGEEMHKRDDKVFLRETVVRGAIYDFAVDMLAPETPGWHTTTWALVNRFDETICTFSVNVFVKQN